MLYPAQSALQMWFMDSDQGGKIFPVLTHPNVMESYNAPRQSLPSIYWQDGYIECISYSLIENQSYPGRIGGWLNKNKTFDIDYISDVPETMSSAEHSVHDHDAIDKKFYPS